MVILVDACNFTEIRERIECIQAAQRANAFRFLLSFSDEPRDALVQPDIHVSSYYNLGIAKYTL